MLIKCYHFCSEEFYKRIINENIIYANCNINYKGINSMIPEDMVKQYVFKHKKLNNGKGMFFCWSNPDYKGNIIYDPNGEYYLLELHVDESECIRTHYENWCSLGMDLYENNNDLEEADLFCREIGFINGLDDSYNSIFAINDSDEIQVLLNKIDKDWIRGIARTSVKYV